jgi:hypothetical protein
MKGNGMTPEQEIDRFWKGQRKAQRQYAEADPFYQAAVRQHDPIKAAERAGEIAYDEKTIRKFVEERTWEEIERAIDG